MRVRLYALVLVLCGVVATEVLWVTPYLWAAVPRPLEIVPGQRIGVVVLGQSMDDAKKVLAQFGAVYDDAAEPGSRRICNSAYYTGLCVQDYRTLLGGDRESTPGKVVFIVTDDARFRGPGELKVGASLIALLHQFGYPRGGRWSAVDWDGFGVALRPGLDGPIVGAIAVFPVVR